MSCNVCNAYVRSVYVRAIAKRLASFFFASFFSPYTARFIGNNVGVCVCVCCVYVRRCLRSVFVNTRASQRRQWSASSVKSVNLGLCLHLITSYGSATRRVRAHLQTCVLRSFVWCIFMLCTCPMYIYGKPLRHAGEGTSVICVHINSARALSLCRAS